ncbi:MAG: beta-propeller fold lactonase family protein [Bifidobacterium sp.]|uniref:Beta-propeller fold lactonase family protein n=1 Tax=Bifidobacterium fermentum TaxID=3059035 RepID=A0AB39UIF0_9BIFI
MKQSLEASTCNSSQELLVGGWGPDGEGSAKGITWFTTNIGGTDLQKEGEAHFAAHGCIAAIPSPSWLCARDDVVFGCLEFSNELVSYRRTTDEATPAQEDVSAPNATADSGHATQDPTIALEELSRVSTPGEGPTHVALCTDDIGVMHILSACYVDGTVTVHPVDSKGRIGAAAQALSGEGHGPLPAQEHSHAHWILPIEVQTGRHESDEAAGTSQRADGSSPRLVLVSDLGADRIRTYHWDNGKLVKHGELHLPAGTGPRDLHILPADPSAFKDSLAIVLISEWSRKAFVMRLDAANPSGISIVDSLDLGASDRDQASSLAYIPDSAGHAGCHKARMGGGERCEKSRCEGTGCNGAECNGAECNGTECNGTGNDAVDQNQGFAYVGLRGTNRIIPLRWNGSSLKRLPEQTDSPWHSGFSSGGSWPRHVLALGRSIIVSNQFSSTLNCFAIAPDGSPRDIGSAQVASPTCVLPISSQHSSSHA